MPKWTTVERKLTHQVAIAGQVSDKETGLTIGNAIVEITAMPEKFKLKRSLQALQYGSAWDGLTKRCDRTVTAADGFFYFIDLPPGSYTLTAFLPGAATRYKPAKNTVTFPPQQKTSSSPKFALANLILSPSGIRGKVTDMNNVAIGKVDVKILGSGESTVTTDNGGYQIVGLEAPKEEGVKRQVKVVFSAKGYREKIEILKFGLGEMINKNCKLTKQNGTTMPNNNTS
jgi:Carboxypeptidase regulatory-like domain